MYGLRLDVTLRQTIDPLLPRPRTDRHADQAERPVGQLWPAG
jgi:hypothetical protein